MRPDNADSDRSGLQNEIILTCNELALLQRSFEESLESWKVFGFEGVRNPVAESLLRDIESRKASLECARKALADYDGSILSS